MVYSEVWECNKSQAASLESIMLGANVFLDVRPKLQAKPFGEIWAWSFCKVGVINVSCWWYKVVSMPLSRYPKNSFKKSGILNHVQVGNLRYGKE